MEAFNLMQTFMPYSDFVKSALVLDYRRLGKQRSEVLQLLRGQWPNHPCSRMWRGHEYALGEYGLAICVAWKARGYKDTCYEKIKEEMKKFSDTGLPSWFGQYDFHLSHRSNLLRKNKEHYSQFFPWVPDNLPYVWPKND